MNHTAFQPASLAGIQLKNRILRSATHEGMADENGVPLADALTKLYVRMAKGDAGAIITGYAGIQADGKSPLHRMTMIDRDEVIPVFKKITDAVHKFDTPIILQIAHSGRQTRSKITGLPVVAPSAVRDKFYSEDLPMALSDTRIKELIQNFVAAIVRAQRSGFDAVQIHAAHGYLLSAFLSSHSNLRTDIWGGTTENKFRIISQIVAQAKEQVKDFPILIKISAHDSQKNGMRIKEAVEIARLSEKAGCDGIEVSCGVAEDGLYTMRSEHLPADAALAYTFKYKHLPGFVKTLANPVLKMVMKQPKPLLKYNLSAAVQIKKVVKIPVIVVGGINNVADIHQIIDQGKIDFVSMSRPFIIQPDIVKKFSQGSQDRSKCIMCNYCTLIGEEKPLKCYYGKLPS